MRRLSLALLVLTLVCTWTTPASAARIFTCGFEENEINVNSSLTMWTTSLASTASLVGTPKHSGNYALKLSTGAFSFLHRDYPSGLYVSGSTLYYRTYFYITALPTTNHQSIMTHTVTVGGTRVKAQVGTDGVMKMYADISGTVATGTTPVPLNTWLRLEMRQFVSATVGQGEGRLYLGDSTVAIDTWGIGNFAGGNGVDENTLQGGQTSILRFTVGDGTNNVTAIAYLDDVAVNDTTGSVNTSWVGPGKISLLTPNSDVSLAWTKAGSTPAATGFGGVNKVPGTPTDFVTENDVSALTLVDRFGMTVLPAEAAGAASFTVYDIYARVASHVASTNQMKMSGFDNAGTRTDGAAFELNTVDTFRMLATSEHFAMDLTGKTLAQVNAYNAGYISFSASAKLKQVNALWVNVEWIPGGRPRHRSTSR